MTQKELDQHEIARNIINARWHRSFEEIATQMNIPLSKIETLQTTKMYENQVWACYGRSPYIFNRHPRHEDCIKHLILFFGITEELANKVLGDDWERNRPDPIQLKIELSEVI